MRKLLSTLFLFITITGISYPQNNWEIVTPKPFQNPIQRMLFIGNNTFIGVAGFNTIYRSSDNGNTWQYQKLNLFSNYGPSNIYFYDNYTGWIITSGGNIFKTINSGLNWFAQESYTNFSLKDIKFINNQTGYIAGFGGTVLKTTDGGNNWNFKGIKSLLTYFNNIEIINSENVLISGVGGQGPTDPIMYRTSNSGNTWLPISSGQRNYTSTVLANNLNYIVLGKDEYFSNFGKTSIFLTSNSGLNWTRVFFDSLSSPFSLTKIGNEIWMLCRKQEQNYDFKTEIYKSTNNGLSWNYVSNLNHNLKIFDYTVDHKLTKDDYGNLYLYMNYNIYKSQNNGLSWIKSSWDILSYTYEIKFLNENTGFSKLYSHLLRTTNGGINWDTVNVPKDKMGDITFADNNTIFFARSDTINNFYKSVNSGLSFSRNNIGSLTPLSVNFHSGILRIIFSERINNRIFNGVLKSVDLGNTFEKTYIDTYLSWGIKKTLFFNNIGYIISERNIYKTTDGGLNWLEIYQTKGEFNIKNSGVIDKNFIWFIKRDMKVFRSYDGGENWDSTLNLTNLNFNTNSFFLNFNSQTNISLATYKIDSTTGLNSAVLLNSSDVGINWNTQYFNFASSIVDPYISMINENSGYCIFTNILLSKNILTNINSNQQNFEIKDFSLLQNYPNPFNPETKIKFNIYNKSKISLNVYDVSGKLISTLVNDNLNEGFYEVEFSGKNLSSGVYFYVLSSNQKTISKKMLLIK